MKKIKKSVILLLVTAIIICAANISVIAEMKIQKIDSIKVSFSQDSDWALPNGYAGTYIFTNVENICEMFGTVPQMIFYYPGATITCQENNQYSVIIDDNGTIGYRELQANTAYSIEEIFAGAEGRGDVVYNSNPDSYIGFHLEPITPHDFSYLEELVLYSDFYATGSLYDYISDGNIPAYSGNETTSIIARNNTPFSDVPAEASYAEAVSILNDLGIITGDDQDNSGVLKFRPEDKLTRAEFCAVVTRAMGIGITDGQVGGIFSDVPAYSWASGYIAAAYYAGIVNGVGNGLFDPEAEVDYDQAVTMLVRALGYEPKAISLGGFPTGYLMVANQESITSGTSNSFGGVTRATLARLTYNSLSVPIYVINEYSFVVGSVNLVSCRIFRDTTNFNTSQSYSKEFISLDPADCYIYSIKDEDGLELSLSDIQYGDVANVKEYVRENNANTVCYEILITRNTDYDIFTEPLYDENEVNDTMTINQMTEDDNGDNFDDEKE